MAASLVNELQAQILGLTDSHIHYFVQNPQYPEHKVGIHKAMLSAFNRLVTKAETQGIRLEIASGFRSFTRQQQIWNNKFSGKTTIKDMNDKDVEIAALSALELVQSILLFSALPGASRHHWGCDIDIYAPNLLISGASLQLAPWEYQSTGPMAKLSTFLADEAKALGFYFPYDKYRGGVAAEPWHLSYAPLANQYQQHFDMAALANCINTADIYGKTTIINELESIVKQFVLNVNPDSKQTQCTL